MNSNSHNGNSHPPEVKPVNRILPFPISEEEELTAMRKELAANRECIARLEGIVSTLQAVLLAREGNSRRNEAEPVREVPSSPQSRPLPEEDKTINRVALCSELVRLLIELGKEIPLGASPKLWVGEKKNTVRVYFIEDHSYLYFDQWGRICAGAKNETSKGVTARRVLKVLYELRDHLPSPIVIAALLKSQFNAFPEE